MSRGQTYVILVLPKCLLTWGYVKVDAAAFCLQHDDRHGESAGPVERHGTGPPGSLFLGGEARRNRSGPARRYCFPPATRCRAEGVTHVPQSPTPPPTRHFSRSRGDNGDHRRPECGVPFRDVQDFAGHADPRTTHRYDRSRHNLDRHATYALVSPNSRRRVA